MCYATGMAIGSDNGGGGIPRKGREVEYATELWLDGPSAFWLHPEGPLSETTPDEWKAKQPKQQPIDILANMARAQMHQAQAQSGLIGYGSMQRLANMQQNQLMNSQGPYISGSLLGKFF